MKRKKLLTVTALCMTTFLMFTGCSSDKDPSASSSSSQTTESTASSEAVSGNTAESTPSTTPSESTTAPEAGTDRKAADLTGLMGKTDEEIVALLGEGTPSTDESKKVTAREYNFTVYGKENTSFVAYDDNGKANMITVNAAQNEFDAWDKLLTEELGATEDAKENDSEGSKTKEKVWKLENNVIVSLRDAYDTLSLEIIVGE